MDHTRMTVPFSEAVASIVPVLLILRNDIGDLCAWMTFSTISLRVLKRMTSPLWDEDGEGWACG